MKQLLRFKTLLLMAVFSLLAGTNAWAQSDYSSVESSNVTLTAGTKASACTVNSGDGMKLGTSKAGGDMTVTVPAGTTHLHLHAAAWKGVSGLSLNISGASVDPTSVSLTADDSFTGSATSFSTTSSAASYYFVIALSDITSETTLTLATSTTKRCVIWGVNAETYSSGGSLADSDLAFSGDNSALAFDITNGATAQTISYTTSSTGAVSVSSSNYATFSVDATNKTITVTPTAATPSTQTITVSQLADDNYKAGSFTFTIDVTQSINNIAAFKALTSGTSATLNLTAAQVLYVSGNDMFVRDATGAIDFYSSGASYTAGQVLNGDITGTYTLYKGMPELTGASDNNLTATDGTVSPTVITTNDASNYVCDYVKLDDVTVTTSDSKFYVDDVQIYDKFGLSYTIEAGGTYDITGIMIHYVSGTTDVYELCPTEAPSVVTPAVTPPSFSVAEGTVAAGTEVTISSDDGTVITYTTDGTDPTTSNTATTTTSNTATVTVNETMTIRAVAVDGDLNISVEATATYEIPDLTLTEVTYDFTDTEWADDQGYPTGTSVTAWAKGNVEIGGDKGTGSTNPKYYTTNGGNLRVYNGSRFTVASTDGTPITSIELVCTSKDDLTLPDGQPGTLTEDTDTYTFTWTAPSSNDVVFVNFSATATTYITSITVTTKNTLTISEQVSVTSAGMGTLYTEQPFEVPTGMTAGTVTTTTGADANGLGTLTIDWAYTEGTIVPPATPLLIKAAEGDYTYTCKGTSLAAPETNLLHGSATATTTTGDTGDKFYMLSYGTGNNADVLGFYYGAAEGAAFTSQAGKCWLAAPATSSVKGFVFDFDDVTTGINSVNTAASNGQAIYDMQGRRVSNATKGVYIIGGKKVLVK